MRPREFIARVIDLFEFDLGPNWTKARPDDLLTAHLQIVAADKTPGFSDMRKIVNSYLFVLEAAAELGLCIIRASMIPSPFQTENSRPLNQPLIEGLRATICFIADDMPVANFPPDDGENANHMFETWHFPPKFDERLDELIEMVTYLILKTNYHLHARQ